MTASPYPVSKGDRVELRVERLAFGGQGVARIDGYTVFVPGGLPGQRVEATVLKRKRAYAEARLERVIEAGPHQVTPRCEHFGLCGGCALQHFDHEAQLDAKREQVRECLARLGGLTEAEVEPTLPSPLVYEYRNKMEFSFGTRWRDHDEMAEGAAEADPFGLGLHVRKRFDRVVNISRCHLVSAEVSTLATAAREAARASGLPPYSTRTHEGFWRFMVVREGANTGDRMVNMITNSAAPGSAGARAVERVAEALRGCGAPVTSLLHGTTDRLSAVAICDQVRTLAGEPVIRDRILDLTFEIGPNTFFQTNTRGAEVLFTEAIARGHFTEDDTVWDLYSGVGALTLPISRHARRVVGMELVPESVAAARRNAALNGIQNAEFFAGDIRALLADPGLRSSLRPDVVMLDPPRDGVHADVALALIDLAPPRIVYVSCNPATLARDLALFAAAGYRLDPVRPVDMFPHTAHIECVASLARADDR
jgi:23S rRNA (uracil1939-C5)-methyltransferase